MYSKYRSLDFWGRLQCNQRVAVGVTMGRPDVFHCQKLRFVFQFSNKKCNAWKTLEYKNRTCRIQIYENWKKLPDTCKVLLLYSFKNILSKRQSKILYATHYLMMISIVWQTVHPIKHLSVPLFLSQHLPRMQIWKNWKFNLGEKWGTIPTFPPLPP